MKRWLLLVAVVSFTGLMAEESTVNHANTGSSPQASSPGTAQSKLKQKTDELMKRLNECIRRPTDSATASTSPASAASAPSVR